MLVLFFGFAWCATQTFTATVTFPVGALPSTQALALSTFNTAQGTLTAVSFTVTDTTAVTGGQFQTVVTPAVGGQATNVVPIIKFTYNSAAIGTPTNTAQGTNQAGPFTTPQTFGPINILPGFPPFVSAPATNGAGLQTVGTQALSVPVVLTDFTTITNQGGASTVVSSITTSFTLSASLVFTFTPAAPPPPPPGGAVGDPHIHGPRGESFDFNGVAGGVYTLLSAPGFVFNVKLAPNGPVTRFMTNIGLLMDGVYVEFDVMRHSPEQLQRYNDALGKVGGSVAFGRFSTELVVDLCDGHSATIYQRRTTNDDIRTLNLTGTFFYLDVEFDAPGCHDEFGGIVGQLYQCAYNTKPFVWKSILEEGFRVPRLESAAGAYTHAGRCPQASEFGERLGKTAMSSI